MIRLVRVLRSTRPRSRLLQLLADTVGTLHRYCLTLSPDNSSHQIVFDAILCSKSLPSDQFKNFIVNLGLIHLFVVSGMHVQLLIKLAEKLLHKCPSWLSKLILTLCLPLYCALCNMAAPVCRASIHKLLCLHFDDRLQKISPPLIVLFQTIGILLLVPQWFESFSFYLSSLAQLTLMSPLKTKWHVHLYIYLVLFLPLAPLQVLSPLTILTNLFLAPVVIMTVFPLSFLGAFVPVTVNGIDWIWTMLFKGLGLIPIQSLPIIVNQKINYAWYWIYFLLIGVLIWRLECRQQRNLYYK